MTAFIGSVWWMIVSLGLLVTFHEFGHYWVARRNGVRVLRFSVGFGRALWSRTARDGTEYVIAMLPLGGYVKMLDEREAPVPAAELPQAFNRKPVGVRIAIVAAGPVANLLLCVALLWAMFVIGRPDYAPVVGAADAIAAQAGLRPGDTLLAVGERATPTWSEASMALMAAAMDRAEVPVSVRQANGQPATRTLDLSGLPADGDPSALLRRIGVTPRHYLLDPLIGRVNPDTPAWGVLAEGDVVTAVDGVRVDAFDAIGPLVQLAGQRGGPAMIEVSRDEVRLALEVTPRLSPPTADGKPRAWQLGIAPARTPLPAFDARLRYGPIAAIPAALAETRRLTADSLAMIGRLVTGRASAANVSGPITIARYANASAQQGVAWFLSFLALLSLSLAIINLMPIPILDGGHLLYYLIELVKGSPLSERAMVAGQTLGLVLLAGLMGLAFFNDILQLLR